MLTVNHLVGVDLTSTGYVKECPYPEEEEEVPRVDI